MKASQQHKQQVLETMGRLQIEQDLQTLRADITQLEMQFAARQKIPGGLDHQLGKIELRVRELREFLAV